MQQPDINELCQRAFVVGYNEARIAEAEGRRAVTCPGLIVQEIAAAYADGVMLYSMQCAFKTGRLSNQYGNA